MLRASDESDCIGASAKFSTWVSRAFLRTYNRTLSLSLAEALPKVDVSEALICHRQVKAPRRPKFPTLCLYTISNGTKVWNANGSFKNRDEMAQSLKRKTKSDEFQGTI
jgi:hypothetical protein